MGGYRISEAARLAGFAPSALRFYESEGLLPPPSRTPGGYRSYDDAAVERLRFVHRARQLGLPLDEIRDLVAVWDAGSCAPAQQGLAERIAIRRQSVQTRIAELQALHAQLLAAEHAVNNADSDGPCGPGCACLATPDRAGEAAASCATTAAPGQRAVELSLLPGRPGLAGLR